MQSELRITVLIAGLLLVGYVIRLLIKSKLSERNSILWIMGCIVVLILSINPDLLTIISNLLRIDYPPALLFLISILFLLFIVLNMSIQISKLNKNINELAQIVALYHDSEKSKEQQDRHAMRGEADAE